MSREMFPYPRLLQALSSHFPGKENMKMWIFLEGAAVTLQEQAAFWLGENNPLNIWQSDPKIFGLMEEK